MMVITVLWIPVLLAPVVWRVHGSVSTSLAAIDYTVWALFALEYLTKLYLFPNRRRFVRTHTLDLLMVVIPFLRPVRLRRVTRLGRFASRCNGPSIVRSQWSAIRVYIFVLPTISVIILASALVVTIAGRHAHGSTICNLGDGLWWAFVTVATVGYGDTSPVTPIGRGIAVFLMLAGSPSSAY